MTDITPADLTAPKPPLPTETGSVIANARGPVGSTCPVMALDRDGVWLGVDSDGILIGWDPDQIADWTPARIVTDEATDAAEPDLMDESDKRPRIDSDGDRVEWIADDDGWGCFGTFDAPTLDRYCHGMDVTIAGWADR